MFYSQLILARKGPLGKIWLAAHYDKKLTKSQIFSTDISESVDSILNPAAPLALRVSGHLMLGVVRIYSKKVKYLMTDCTEAMWKIKLAFRPGNAEAIDLQTNVAHNIDDLRYFGHVLPDTDYPDLDDLAFSQSMLSRFDHLRAAGGRTLAAVRDTTQEEDESAMFRGSFLSSRQGSRRATGATEDADLIDIPAFDETYSLEGGQRGSQVSRVSDVGMVRGEQRQRLSHTTARSSLSSIGGHTTAGMMAGIAGSLMMDDDVIPAFDESMFPDDMGAPPFLAEEQFGEEFLPPVSMAAPEPTSPVVTSATSAAPPPAAVSPQSQRSEEGGEEEDQANAKKAKAKPKRRGKKQRVAIDRAVELPSRVIKEKMADVSSTLRRRPEDRISLASATSTIGGGALNISSVSSAEERLAQPSVDGLCPELRELFSMTMTTGPLPFPRSEHEEEEAAEQTAALDRLEGSTAAGRVSEIELARRGETPLRGAEAGRPSILSQIDQLADKGYAEEEQYFGEELAPPMFEEEGQISLDMPSPHLHEQPPSPVPLGALGLSVDLKEGPTTATAAPSAVRTSEGTIGSAQAWNPRTAAVLNVLKDQFRNKESISFDEISSGVSRRLAAASFLEVLQLKTWGYIDVNQPAPFSDIELLPTEQTWSTVPTGIVSASS